MTVRMRATAPPKLMDDSITAIVTRMDESVVWGEGEVTQRVSDALWRAKRDARLLRLTIVRTNHRIEPVGIVRTKTGAFADCSACGLPVYESGDHRGGRWLHDRAARRAYLDTAR